MKKLLSILTLPFLVAACGGGGGGDDDKSSGSNKVASETTIATTAPVSTTNPSAKYVNTQTFNFTAAINPATVTALPDKTIKLVNMTQSGLGKSYAVATQAELDALNQKIPEQQRISLDNLSAYTYFLIRAPGCDSYMEFSGSSYAGSTLAISLNQFTLPTKICLDPMTDYYLVYRAAK